MKDFRSLVEGERPYLLRYARLQLRDGHAAEDAVQETLLAALAGEAAFAGRSNLRTWLTGILKHKIIDALRRLAREAPLARTRASSRRSSTSAATGATLRATGRTPTRFSGASSFSRRWSAASPACRKKAPRRS
jgi:RNA polymerase sigma factor (sigma-70 family)